VLTFPPGIPPDYSPVDIPQIISMDIHLYSPYNMVAQANNTGTSKNTTNEKEIMTVPLYTY